MPGASSWYSDFSGASGTLPAGFTKFGGGIAELSGTGALRLAQAADTNNPTGVRSGSGFTLVSSPFEADWSVLHTAGDSYLAIRSATSGSALRYAWVYSGGTGRYNVFESSADPDSFNGSNWTNIYSRYEEPPVARRRITRTGPVLGFERWNGSEWVSEHTVTLTTPSDYDDVELYVGVRGFASAPVPVYEVTQVGQPGGGGSGNAAVLHYLRESARLAGFTP